MQFRLDYGITTLILLSLPPEERKKRTEEVSRKIKRWYNAYYQEALEIFEDPHKKIQMQDYGIFVPQRIPDGKILVNYYWYRTLPAILLLRYYHAIKNILNYLSIETQGNMFSFIIAIDPNSDYYLPLKYLEYPDELIQQLKNFNYGLFYKVFFGVEHPNATQIIFRYFKEINDITSLSFDQYTRIFNMLYENRAILQKYKQNAIEFFNNEEKFISEYQKDIETLKRIIYQAIIE